MKFLCAQRGARVILRGDIPTKWVVTAQADTSSRRARRPARGPPAAVPPAGPPGPPAGSPARGLTGRPARPAAPAFAAAPQGQGLPRAEPSAGGGRPLNVGERVEACWGNSRSSRWYPGVVDKIVYGGYEVRWDDDGSFNVIVAEKVRPAPPPPREDLNALL